jgi:hypothetical protein
MYIKISRIKILLSANIEIYDKLFHTRNGISICTKKFTIVMVGLPTGNLLLLQTYKGLSTRDLLLLQAYKGLSTRDLLLLQTYKGLSTRDLLLLQTYKGLSTNPYHGTFRSLTIRRVLSSKDEGPAILISAHHLSCFHIVKMMLV